MNCTEFDHHWNDLITHAIDESHREAMESHAATCGTCGPKWSAHQELETTIQSILEAHPMPKDLAVSTANETYQARFGSAVALGSSKATGRGESSGGLQPALVLSLVLGAGMLGYLIGSGRGQSSPMQQLMSAQMMFGGRSQNPQEMMLVSELMGVGGGRGFLPPITVAVQTACLAVALVWLTRSKLWTFVFPSKLPIGVRVARWLGLVTALLGAGRCFGYVYASLTLFNTQGSGRGVADLGWVTGSLTQINQLWAGAFWLTILILILTSAERVIQSAFAMSDRHAQ